MSVSNSLITLDQQLRRVEISPFEVDNQIVFEYFNNLSSSERDEKFIRAIYIGVLALMEDRIAAFLSKTNNELGTELESLKLIFEMKKELFYKTAIKGALLEGDILEFLINYFEERHLKDTAYISGNTAGSLPKNKTGDIICEVNGEPQVKIVIECKFDKSVKLGEIEAKDVFTKKTDTAWSQLLESQINREAKIGLIVFDISLVDISILRKVDNVGYIPGIGLIAIIDLQKGDYTNLGIAYLIARDLIIHSSEPHIDKDLLAILISRVVKDLNEIISIKSLVQTNIENCKSILKQIEKSILLAEFNQRYLTKYLTDGNINKKDLFDFYQGEEIRTQYNLLEKDIKGML